MSGPSAKDNAVAGPPPTLLGILIALSCAHLINDTFQAIIPAIYPLLKLKFSLTFAQIGLITLSYQFVGSVLQPIIGAYTDGSPRPYSLAAGMAFSMAGLVVLAQAASYPWIVVSAILVGIGSSIFHPEAYRVAHMAAGHRPGFAQSLFQMGGNLGYSLGPLFAALIIVPWGQTSILWIIPLALGGIVLLTKIGSWYRHHLTAFRKRGAALPAHALSRGKVRMSLLILLILLFSKYFYLVCLTNYYTFYLIQRFHLSTPDAQFLLAVFLGAIAAGTLIGGPLGDRFGRKVVIWISILGIAPFSLLLPHVGLEATVILTILIGFVMASAFPAMVVYGQELLPGKVGAVSGLLSGLAFGVGGIASAALGKLADLTSIGFFFNVFGFLPLIGLLAWFLPDIEGANRRARRLQVADAPEITG